MLGGQRQQAAAALAIVALAVAISGCGGASTQGSAQPRHLDPDRWLQVDAARRTATITLALGFGAEAAGLNIDGAVKGALLFSVPSGWRVHVECENFARQRRYSCVLERAPGVPVLDPAIVDVLHPTAGLEHGESSSFQFTAPRPTRYRLIAVSDRRAATGMWVVLKVSAGGAPYARWLR
jgi:hypothetical protein